MSGPAGTLPGHRLALGIALGIALAPGPRAKPPSTFAELVEALERLGSATLDVKLSPRQAETLRGSVRELDAWLASVAQPSPAAAPDHALEPASHGPAG